MGSSPYSNISFKATLHSRIDAATIARTRTAYRVGFLTYAFAMLVAFVSPAASLALYIIIVAYYLIHTAQIATHESFAL